MQAHEPGEELESGTHPGGGAGGGGGGHIIHNGPSGSGYYAGGHNNHQHSHPMHYGMSGRERYPEGVRETREEMVNLKHAYKEQVAKEPALPPSASWASKNNNAPSSSSSHPYSSNDQFTSAHSSPALSHRPTPPPQATTASTSNNNTTSSTSNHAHTSSISSRLPKAQNHPLPPRPPSRAPSMDLTRSRSLNQKDKERERERDLVADKESSQSKPPLSDRVVPPAQAQSTSSTTSAQEPVVSLPNVISPPTPPASEPSGSSKPSTSSQQASQTNQLPPNALPSAFPPGLPVPMGRPLTPVSEFDRTLDTFGDGSFAFNLSAANSSSTPTSSPFGAARNGKDRLMPDDAEDEEIDTNGDHDGDSRDGRRSMQTSREGSPKRQRSNMSILNGIDGRDSSNHAANTEEQDDPSKSAYQGPFDPFAFAGDAASSGEDIHLQRSESPATFSSGFTNGKTEGPPGLSRANTNASSQDGNFSAGVTRGGPPPGFKDTAAAPTSARHGSRFGFARAGSAERATGSVGTPHASGSGNGISIPVAELFKGITGVPGFPGTSLNGVASPIRPASAQSSGSGYALGAPPPGIFSPSVLNNGHSTTASSNSGTAAAPGLPMSGQSSSNANLASIFAAASPAPMGNASSSSSTTSGQGGSVTPSKPKQLSLADLFPGVDLSASFSSNALPDALVKSLGGSLENLDLSATSAASGKLPGFAPLQPGQNLGLASLPLPPKSGSSSNGHAQSQQQTPQGSNPASSSASPVPHQQGQNGSIVLSHGGLPPGLGTSRQAQQAHAQNAQQAHQAHLAAQQAQAAAAAAAAAAQHSQSLQHQVHTHSHHFGRPPSAASAGSKLSQDAMYPASAAAYLKQLQGVASPSIPMPGTPGGPYGDATAAGRFQDPAIVSFAGLNGFGPQHMQHNPYASPYGLHGALDQASPGSAAGPPGSTPSAGAVTGDFYSRYHPLPTPVQAQQPYNPYIPVGPVGLGGMPGNGVNIPGGINRLQTGQPMSPGGGFGMLRR
jgi:hypothetical protein